MGHNVSMHAGGSKSGGSHLREEQFSGVALIQLISAQLQLKGKWFACVAIGEQTFLTATSIQQARMEI
jgi:phosphatidylserine decarboxylase